jgi:hypothetical protein
MRFRFPPIDAVGFPGSTPGSILEVPFMTDEISFTVEGTEASGGYDMEVRITEQEDSLLVEWDMMDNGWFEAGEIPKDKITNLGAGFDQKNSRVAVINRFLD